MNDLVHLLQGGNAWLFLPSAIVLGALHGLEPGHSKTMMAAFIIAVRGTLGQAVLLGLAATLSHTAVVWLVAMGGLYFGQHWSAEASEPWMQLASAVLILGVGGWMLWRTTRHEPACFHDHGAADAHGHDHGHGNGHDHAAHGHGHGHGHGHDHDHDHGHDHDHDHDHAAPGHHEHAPGRAACEHAPGHAHCDHEHGGPVHGHDHGATALSLGDVPQDAHARAHADDIQRRFAGRHVTTGQIVMFGLTGGLVPCPASITVLLLCLQLKRVALGATLVLGFSIGLALTMVASGVVAALGVRHLSRRLDSGRFGALAAKAPYLSAVLILGVGGVLGWQALRTLGFA